MILKDLIDRILSEVNFKDNIYFAHLLSGEFQKDDFVETQIQFYNAVVFFSRPMSALIAKIPTPQLRMEVLRNVWEEHGEGNFKKTHAQTFLEFLNRLNGTSVQDVDQRIMWPEIRIFNTALAGACILDDYLIGVGLMGMIERMFYEISAQIAQAVIERGWLTKEQMIHYNLHQDLDERHSQDFFDILQPAWNLSVEKNYLIEQGLRMGATLFNGLYEGLYRSRRTRVLR